MKLWHYQKEEGRNWERNLICMAENREEACKKMTSYLHSLYEGKIDHKMDEQYLREADDSVIELNVEWEGG